MRHYHLHAVFLAFLLLMSLISAHSANAVEATLHNLKVVSIGGKANISYAITNASTERFTRIGDQLKAGNALRIAHNVNLTAVDSIDSMKGDIADVEVSKYISLDVLSDTYSYGENIDNLKTTKDTNFIKAYIFSTIGESLGEEIELITGEEYLINVSFYAEPYGAHTLWSDYLPKSWLHDTLNIKELYIAR
ncbi:MAG: hypothetical protein ACI9TY_001176 [Alphaproteobacteria bacterium]|jgi:hypothetical protein